MHNYEKRIEADYLRKCSPEAAYSWLKDNWTVPTRCPAYSHSFYVGEGKEGHDFLEKLLVRRKDPLIDLGVARWGYSKDALSEVFVRGGSAQRCAVLANPAFWSVPNREQWRTTARSESLRAKVYQIIDEIVQRGHEYELEALAQNPYLDNSFYEKMLLRDGEFADLSDNAYKLVLRCLGQNLRMREPDESWQLDGYSTWEHENIFRIAWKLTGTLPATEEWAEVLYALLEKVQPVWRLDDIDDVLERWRIEDDDEKKEQWPQSSAALLRKRLADLKEPDKELLESSDYALRRSFYRRFNPTEFSNWSDLVRRERQKGLFYLSLCGNEELWRSAQERERLEELACDVEFCGSGSLELLGDYKTEEVRMKERHPNWFDEEVKEKNHETERVLERFDQLSEEIHSLLTRLNSGLLSFVQNVAAVKSGRSSGLLWLLAGLLIGYFVFR